MPARTLPLEMLGTGSEQTSSELPKKVPDNILARLAFVVTGDLTTWPDKENLKMFIESAGGRMNASVTNKTNYLIANNPNSGTAELKKAHELGVQIIDEQAFLEMAGLK